jgi:hypothetical protein
MKRYYCAGLDVHKKMIACRVKHADGTIEHGRKQAAIHTGRQIAFCQLDKCLSRTSILSVS